MTPETLSLLDSQTAVHDAWRLLMGPLGFSRRSLWLLLIDPDHRVSGTVTCVEDLPTRPSSRDQDRLVDVLRHIGDGRLRVAFLLSRPGRDGLTAADRQWSAALGATCREAGLAHETVHRANDLDLVPVSLDDLPSGAIGLR